MSKRRPKRKSLSRWAKDNKDMIKGVKFGVKRGEDDDKNWRRKGSYKRWRMWVLLRDDYHCQLCGSTRRLSAHHIIPASVCPELRYDIRNGLTLCWQCHTDKHDYLHRMQPRFWKNIKRDLR